MKLVAALALLLALAACGDRAAEIPEPAELQTSAMGASPAPALQPRDDVDDTAIVAQIRKALTSDRELSQFMIDVDSKDGLVILSGVAASAAARERATEIARHTPQVQDISNQLTVKRG